MVSDVIKNRKPQIVCLDETKIKELRKNHITQIQGKKKKIHAMSGQKRLVGSWGILMGIDSNIFEIQDCKENKYSITVKVRKKYIIG